jgi:hypothetical protein
MKLFSPDSTHWYQRDGAPLHTVLSLKGEPRPTTLRDARKLGLLPSVTNILGVIAKPGLISWLQEQAVLAALTLPRIAGESEDTFAKRVVEDSLSPRDGAADFGTAFHHGAEQIAQSLEVDRADPLSAWLNLYRDWYQANCVRLLWTEQRAVSQLLGYAGTADLLIEHKVHGLCLVDLKTMKCLRTATGKTAKPKPYSTWCYQLAAYRAALGVRATCINVVVNSVTPESPVEHVWTEAEMESGLRAFMAARELWMVENGYNPAAPLNPEAAQHRTPNTERPTSNGDKGEIVLAA